MENATNSTEYSYIEWQAERCLAAEFLDKMLLGFKIYTQRRKTTTTTTMKEKTDTNYLHSICICGIHGQRDIVVIDMDIDYIRFEQQQRPNQQHSRKKYTNPAKWKEIYKKREKKKNKKSLDSRQGTKTWQQRERSRL